MFKDVMRWPAAVVVLRVPGLSSLTCPSHLSPHSLCLLMTRARPASSPSRKTSHLSQVTLSTRSVSIHAYHIHFLPRQQACPWHETGSSTLTAEDRSLKDGALVLAKPLHIPLHLMSTSHVNVPFTPSVLCLCASHIV